MTEAIYLIENFWKKIVLNFSKSEDLLKKYLNSQIVKDLFFNPEVNLRIDLSRFNHSYTYD